MGKKILILGGGIGGIVSANELRKKLSEEHRIILINREAGHIFNPSLLWLLFGWRKSEEITRDLSLLGKKGIEFQQGEIKKIDPANRSVTVESEEINYDYLIISLGAELNKEKIPKKENIFNFYCLKGAELAREKIKNFTSGKIVVLISSSPFKCPAAPYEVAFLLDYVFKQKNIREKIEIAIYTPEPLPMPAAGPEAGNAIKEMLLSQKIGFFPQHKFKEITEKEIIFENGQKSNFDLLLVVPPHRAPAVVRESGLVSETGWIPVEPKTLKTKFESVYAIGDITGIKLPGQYKPDVPLNLPKAGFFAHYQAKVVSENIAQEILGNTPRKEFDGKGSCFLEIGYKKAGFAQGEFYSLPHPQVKMRKPSRPWHWYKILFEKYWFSHNF